MATFNGPRVEAGVRIAGGRSMSIAATLLLGFVASGAAAREVQIHATIALAFLPRVVQVEVGDRITWINDSGVMHEIYFQNNPTSSGEDRLRYVLTGVHKISIVVTRPGNYDYVCRWHGMWGSIRVAEKSRP